MRKCNTVESRYKEIVGRQHFFHYIEIFVFIQTCLLNELTDWLAAKFCHIEIFRYIDKVERYIKIPLYIRWISRMTEKNYCEVLQFFHCQEGNLKYSMIVCHFLC